jgi:hypothetical protein
LPNILLTGGRAPVALDLARIFWRAGHTVFIAESVPWHLCRGSRAVAGCFRVPPPNRQPQQFIAALVELVRRHRIDWLIPTCEETMFVAAGRPQLANWCTVFTDRFDTLRTLHNKLSFAQRVHSRGLPVPPTELATSTAHAAQLLNANPKLVFKPVYSRFGTQTLICPRRPPNIAPGQPWVAQHYLPGRQLCTYSVAHAGQLAAHSAYAVKFTTGPGATIHFKADDHPAAGEWVRRFVAFENFTGQIAFDFIETGPGQVAAIECNPRATSGLHLFGPELADAFLSPPDAPLTPPAGQSAQITGAMLLNAPANLRRHGFKSWVDGLTHGREVIFDRADPWPGLVSQWATLAYFLGQSARHRIGPIAATTFDIEMNGGELTMSNEQMAGAND